METNIPGNLRQEFIEECTRLGLCDIDTANGRYWGSTFESIESWLGSSELEKRIQFNYLKAGSSMVSLLKELYSSSIAQQIRR